jgi:hypothetical protein
MDFKDTIGGGGGVGLGLFVSGCKVMMGMCERSN